MTSFPLGFSSIGMPDASIAEVFDTAIRYHCDFVELRILQTGKELYQYLDEHGAPPVPIRVLGSSFQLTNPSKEAMDSFENIARLADLCGARYVRVFGGGEFSWEPLPEQTLKVAATTVRRCQDMLQEKGFACETLVETHDSLSSSDDCSRLNDLLDLPLNILWDSHHTWRLAGESPSYSWGKIAPLVRHVHYKDSILLSAENNTFRYVNPGSGDFPAADLFATLKAGGYESGISLEWERMWHPELAPIHEALKSFQDLVRAN